MNLNTYNNNDYIIYTNTNGNLEHQITTNLNKIILHNVNMNNIEFEYEWTHLKLNIISKQIF